MNIVPMFMNLFIPWATFVFCCGLCSSWMMYTRPIEVWVLLSVVAVAWIFSLYGAIVARREAPEPTWFTYVTCMAGVAAISGSLLGLINYEKFGKPYFEIQDLKVIHDVNANQYGVNNMDAGVVFFSSGTQVDSGRSWHFKHRGLYCVAPLMTNFSSLDAPLTHFHDYWVVGKDCCSDSASDFRCGALGHGSQQGGLRVLDNEAIPYYQLAVQQAESIYGITAQHPVFLVWYADPLTEVSRWGQRVFTDFAEMVAFAFVVSLFCMTMASAKFAFIGRGEAAFYSDLGSGSKQAATDFNMAGYGAL